MPTARHFIVSSALIAPLLVFAPALAAPVVPASLHPGDPYYLAFVSKDALTSASASISTYNQFAQNEAALDPALTGTSDGVVWHAIASTASTGAIANLGLSAGVPIFLLDGTTEVSVTDGSGWLGATLEHAIDHDQFAAAVPGGGDTFAWTGTNSAGTITGAFPLGDGRGVSELGGVSGFTGSQWIDFGVAYSTNPLSLYAVSSLLVVVPGDVNRDGIVNSQDIGLVASNWLATGSNPADANDDGIVNGQDIAEIASNWLATSASAGGGAGAVSVPEPSSLVLAWLGVVGFSARRRQRR